MAHFVNLLSNAQGVYYFSANRNTYYLGIDSDGNFQVLRESEIDDAVSISQLSIVLK